MVTGLIALDGVPYMANIVDQDEGLEASLTETLILDAYRTFLAADWTGSMGARTGSKPEDDAEHTYEVLQPRAERVSAVSAGS